MENLRVELGENSYDIIFRSDFGDLADSVKTVAKTNKILVVTDSNVAPLYGDEVTKKLADGGFDVSMHVFDAGEENKGIYDFDNLHLDMNRYELKVKGKVVEAPPKELELLACLAGHPNRVYTRDQLLDEVWGFEYYGDSRTIDVHVKRLREKLEGASDQWNLKTVWGVGYTFAVRE